MRNYIIKLPAGEEVPVQGLNADYMRIIDGSDRLTVTPDELQPLEGMQKGMSYRTPQAFNKLTLLSETVQTVEIMIGFGNISDDRLNLSGSVDASSGGRTVEANAETVTTSAAELLAANTARRSVMIKNMDTANSIFVGHDGTLTDSNGFEIEPLQTLTLDKSAAAQIYAIAQTASVNVRLLVESD